MEGDEDCAALSVSATACASADPGLDLPDAMANQEELDEAVNEWLFDLELEGLTSGLPTHVCIGGVIHKAPLSSMFGAPLDAQCIVAQVADMSTVIVCLSKATIG